MTAFSLRLAAALCLGLSLATSALAQVFPSENGTPVIDDAGLLPDADEARLVSQLAGVKADSGAEVWVVTLLNTALYAGGEDVAAYAELLFAELGLAEVPSGKAALLVVFQEDRELAIHVGPAYSAAQAQAIVDDLILPSFREDDFAAGIEAGVQGMIGQLALPATPVTEPATPAEPVTEPSAPASGGGGNALYWVLGVVAAGIAGIVAMVRRSAAKLAATPCPSCGKTGLTRGTVTVQEATQKAEGRGETRTTCPHCGHVDAVPFTIAKLDHAAPAKAAPKAPGPGDKGQGGGATGSW